MISIYKSLIIGVISLIFTNNMKKRELMDNIDNIKNKKPAPTCTLCGDCLSACGSDSIKYKFFGLKPQHARNLYLFISVSLHAMFLCLARI